MSKMAAATFLKRLADEPDLQRELRASATERGNAVTATLALAQQQGYEFTAAEFAQTMDLLASGELSDEDLEVVSGGGSDAGSSERLVLPMEEIKFTYAKIDWTSDAGAAQSDWQIESA